MKNDKVSISTQSKNHAQNDGKMETQQDNQTEQNQSSSYAKLLLQLQNLLFKPIDKKPYVEKVFEQASQFFQQESILNPKKLDDFTIQVHVNDQIANKLCDEGDTLSRQGLFQSSLPFYDKALSIRKNHVRALMGKAISLKTKKRFTEALQEYDKVLEIDPKLITAFLGKGSIFTELEKFEQAKAQFKYALELDRSVSTILRTVVTLIKAREYKNALNLVDEAIVMAPKDKGALILKCQILCYLEEFYLTVVCCKKVLVIDASNAIALNILAQSFHALQDYRQFLGMMIYKDLLQQNPFPQTSEWFELF